MGCTCLSLYMYEPDFISAWSLNGEQLNIRWTAITITYKYFVIRVPVHIYSSVAKVLCIQNCRIKTKRTFTYSYEPFTFSWARPTHYPSQPGVSLPRQSRNAFEPCNTSFVYLQIFSQWNLTHQLPTVSWPESAIDFFYAVLCYFDSKQ